MGIMRRALRGMVTAAALWAMFGPAHAGDGTVLVMNSGGFSAAYKALQPAFEKASGQHLVTAWGPSMGQSPDAIPNRLARGEQADGVILVGYALDALVAKGLVQPGSRVDLADSRIGMVIKAGAPRPDISSVDALRATLLAARSIAYSDSASGVYVERELFRKLGIEDQVKGKATKVQQTPVAQKVAAGDYELGFQQVSEILPVAGIEFVGRIPESVQSVTTFAAGIPVGAPNPQGARALISFLAAPQARDEIVRSGLDPCR